MERTRAQLTADGTPEPEEPIGIGVIGLGFGARTHVPGFQLLPETRVVAVCSAQHARVTMVAERYGIEGAYTSYQTLLRDPRVTAVSIAVPPHLHHQITMAALLAGKHVLCEQPLARTVAEARDMVRQAEAAGVIHMVNHEYRFLPTRQRFKELVEAGYLGELRTATMTVVDDTLADASGHARGWLTEREKGGGMLAARGSHAIDGLLWWFGPVLGVTGRLATTVPQRRDPATGQPCPVTADDTAIAILQFCTGGLASLHIAGTAWHPGGEHLEAYGSEGTLVLTGDGQLLGARRGEPLPVALPVSEPADTLPVPADAPPRLVPFMRLARVFATAIRTGQQPAPSFVDGLRVQEVLEAVQRATRDEQQRTPRGQRALLARD